MIPFNYLIQKGTKTICATRNCTIKKTKKVVIKPPFLRINQFKKKKNNPKTDYGFKINKNN